MSSISVSNQQGSIKSIIEQINSTNESSYKANRNFTDKLSEVLNTGDKPDMRGVSLKDIQNAANRLKDKTQPKNFISKLFNPNIKPEVNKLAHKALCALRDSKRSELVNNYDRSTDVQDEIKNIKIDIAKITEAKARSVEFYEKINSHEITMTGTKEKIDDIKALIEKAKEDAEEKIGDIIKRIKSTSQQLITRYPKIPDLKNIVAAAIKNDRVQYGDSENSINARVLLVSESFAMEHLGSDVKEIEGRRDWADKIQEKTPSIEASAFNKSAGNLVKLLNKKEAVINNVKSERDNKIENLNDALKEQEYRLKVLGSPGLLEAKINSKDLQLEHKNSEILKLKQFKEDYTDKAKSLEKEIVEISNKINLNKK